MSRNMNNKKRNKNNRKNATSNSCSGRSNFRKTDIRELKSDEDTSRSSNDPTWYASNPTILRDAASYPFSYVTGASDIHNPAVWDANIVELAPINQVPGIASFHVYPNIGTSVNSTDPINVAAQSVYSFVRHANSGHSNYDPADLMLYILAMANMYSFLVWCQRLYGYALTYDQRNRYIPKDLIRTNNVDADDLTNNLANFRFWINTLIAKMVSFAVPATMSIFSRMSFMYSDYYIEGTSIKEQLYQFVPEGFYKFGIDSESLGNLEWKPFDWTKLMSVKDVMEYGDSLFNAIWSQEDFGIMSGDVLKAYGDNIIKLAQIPESYAMIPKFDAMVLTQMKNADVVPVTPNRIAQSASTGNIIQTLIPTGYTVNTTYYGNPSLKMGDGSTKFNSAMVSMLKDYNVLTVDVADPTPDVVIEATRLKVGYDAYKAWYICGTEMIVKVTLTKQPGSDCIIEPIINIRCGDSNDVVSFKALQETLEVAKNFHYLPRITTAAMNAVSAKMQVKSYFDIDNFTVLTFEDIRKLHEAATINMFAVPSIGKVQ